MNIYEFIRKFKNYPVLFIGSGITLRYLKYSYSWDELLKKTILDLYGDEKVYLDLKYKYQNEHGYNFPKIASEIETLYDKVLDGEVPDKFKKINEDFYSRLKNDKPVSRFKIYLSNLLNKIEFRSDEKVKNEIEKLKIAKKNIASVITTNYDFLLEEIFSFEPLVGNDILLSSPLGSIYKIHGSISNPESIIITENDYEKFENKYQLIKSQLISLFIHNPIIFLGYSIDDNNIRSLLKTVFSYVDIDSEIGKQISNNFLLVNYSSGSDNTVLTEHSIHIDGHIIKINKLSTDNFMNLYDAILNLHLPVSVMDIRKVEKIVKKIKSGGEIKVHIVEDIDALPNSETVLAIGSDKTLTYVYQKEEDYIKRYFEIINNAENDVIKLIDSMSIRRNHYFPVFGFYNIENNLESYDKLRDQQINKIEKAKVGWSKKTPSKYNKPISIKEILDDENIVASSKEPVILYAAYNDLLSIDDIEDYLLNNIPEKITTFYRQLLCVYDLKKYGNLQRE
jgi:hypothetical protein